MTDKQPDALRLADELEDSLESHDGSSLTARCQGIADDAAAELRRLHAELETLTLYKNLADEYGLSIFKDLKDLTTEIENLREKLKTYEDLGGAADDMQLLRMGYAAARLEIESLRAAQPAGAQQPGGAGLVDALEDAQRAINSMKVEAETAAQGDEQMMLEACETISSEGLQADMAIRAALASHWQASAGAYKDSTPDLHVGDSSFESWYADYVKEGTKGLKQHCRDAYAAGMGDPLVTAAPAAVAGPSVKYVPVSSGLRNTNWNHPNDDEPRTQECLAALRERGDDKGQGLDGFWKWGFAAGFNAALAAAPTTQPAPQPLPASHGDAQEPVAWYVTGYSRLLDEDEAKAEARRIGGTARAMPLYTAPQADSQPAGADRHGLPPLPDPDLRDVGTTPRDIKEFLRGYATEYALTALTARAPADSVLEDAERYRWLRERMLGIDFDWNESGITALSFEMPDGCAYGGCCNQNIDAARAAQEGK